MRDESDRKSKLRLVIEPRTSKIDADEMMAALMVHTSLETRYAINLTWIGLDGYYAGETLRIPAGSRVLLNRAQRLAARAPPRAGRDSLRGGRRRDRTPASARTASSGRRSETRET